MKPPYKLPKWKPIWIPKPQEISLIFDRTERLIKKHPLIILKQGDYYYYLSFRSMHDKWGTVKKQHEGEIKISPTKNQTTIEVFSYLDISHIYCMKKEDMELFFDDLDERQIDALNLDDQKKILKKLHENLRENPPWCSVLQVNYDQTTKKLTPDLIFCHPRIWKATKEEWQWKRRRDIARIEEKLDYHKSKGQEEEEGSDGRRVGSDLDVIRGDLQQMLWKNGDKFKEMNQNQNENIEDENDHFLSHEPQAEWEEYHLKQEDSSREIRAMLKAARTKVSLKSERDWTPPQEWNFKESKNDQEQNELEPKKTREQDDDDEGR